MVIERYKSGFLPPEDWPFEDLSNIRSGSIGSDSSSNGGGGGGGSLGSGAINSTISLPSSIGLKSETKSGTMSALKLKKRAGLFGIFNAGKVINYHALSFFEYDFDDQFDASTISTIIVAHYLCSPSLSRIS